MFLLFLLFVKGAFAPFHKWFVEVLNGVRRQIFV